MTPREYQKQAIKRLEAEHGPDNWFVKALKQQHDSVSQQKQATSSKRLIAGVRNGTKPAS